MSKEKFDLNTFISNVQTRLLELRRYSVYLFLGLVVVLYGFLLYRINVLSQAQPSAVTVSSDSRSQSLRIDQNVIKQLQSLQDNSVSVKALFNDARNNPFQ
jgi:hypothetical protein